MFSAKLKKKKIAEVEKSIMNLIVQPLLHQYILQFAQNLQL